MNEFKLHVKGAAETKIIIDSFDCRCIIPTLFSLYLIPFWKRLIRLKKDGEIKKTISIPSFKLILLLLWLMPFWFSHTNLVRFTIRSACWSDREQSICFWGLYKGLKGIKEDAIPFGFFMISLSKDEKLLDFILLHLVLYPDQQ